MPPLGVGSAGACGGLLRRGGLPPPDLQREGWVDNRRIPRNLPLYRLTDRDHLRRRRRRDPKGAT